MEIILPAPVPVPPQLTWYILVGCKTSLQQGFYTWQCNQVVKCLAAVLERRRKVCILPPLSSQPFTAGCLSGKAQVLHSVARDWKLLADLGQRFCIPEEINSTSFRPELVIYECKRPNSEVGKPKSVQYRLAAKASSKQIWGPSTKSCGLGPVDGVNGSVMQKG